MKTLISLPKWTNHTVRSLYPGRRIRCRIRPSEWTQYYGPYYHVHNGSHGLTVTVYSGQFYGTCRVSSISSYLGRVIHYLRDNTVRTIASTLKAVCGFVTDPFSSTWVRFYHIGRRLLYEFVRSLYDFVRFDGLSCAISKDFLKIRFGLFDLAFRDLIQINVFFEIHSKNVLFYSLNEIRLSDRRKWEYSQYSDWFLLPINRMRELIDKKKHQGHYQTDHIWRTISFHRCSWKIVLFDW